jgi:hypothetical protein
MIPGSFNPFRVLLSRDSGNSEGVMKSELDLAFSYPIVLSKLRIYFADFSYLQCAIN